MPLGLLCGKDSEPKMAAVTQHDRAGHRLGEAEFDREAAVYGWSWP